MRLGLVEVVAAVVAAAVTVEVVRAARELAHIGELED